MYEWAGVILRPGPLVPMLTHGRQGQGAVVRRIALDGAETTWPGLLLLPGFLAGFSRDGGILCGRSPKYRKIFKICLENFFRYDIMKNYLYLKPKNPCHEGRAKTQQIKTLGGN